MLVVIGAITGCGRRAERTVRAAPEVSTTQCNNPDLYSLGLGQCEPARVWWRISSSTGLVDLHTFTAHNQSLCDYSRATMVQHALSLLVSIGLSV